MMEDIGQKITGHELDDGEGNQTGPIPNAGDLKSEEDEG